MLLGVLVVVGQVELLLVQDKLVILRHPHLLLIQMQPKEILGVTELQMEPLVLLAVAVELVLLGVMQQLTDQEVLVEVVAQELLLLFQARL